MKVVNRAIDRVHDPFQLFRPSLSAGTLFPDNARLRKVAVNDRGYLSLAFMIEPELHIMTETLMNLGAAGPMPYGIVPGR